MKSILLFLSLELLSFCQVMAQDIKGKIVDETGKPISFANVVLLNRQDSSFVKGTVSGNDGGFVIGASCDHGIIKVSSVGYKTAFKDCNGDDVTVVLAEDSKMLGEVVVKSSLPRTILTNGGMKTTVAGSVLEKAGTMDNLLDRVPNVSAQNGTIKVFGRGEPLIYINGKQMRDKSELDRLRSDNIKSVEVITNPGARYPASAKAVICITTKKTPGEGLGIDATAMGEYDEKYNLGANGRLNVNYRKNGLELGAYASVARQYQPDYKGVQQITYLDKTWNQKSEIKQTEVKESMNYRIDASYQIDTNNSIGANFSYLRNPKDSWNGDMNTSILQDETLSESNNSHTDLFGQRSNMSSNIYYIGKIGKLGIDFNTDWLWDKARQNDVTDEHFQEIGQDWQDQAVRSITNKYNHLLASKLVLTYPLLGGELSVGGEFSNVHRTSKMQVVPANIVNDDNSRVTESMTSSFLSYSRDFGSLSLEAGLRYEYIDFDYYECGKRIAGQSKTYGNWFPSLSLSLPVGNAQMQLSYSADINRPSYQSLRSAVQYDNRYTYETGNPLLMAEINRDIDYEVSYKWLTFDVSYFHTSNPIMSYVNTYKDNPAIGLMKPINGKAYDGVESSVTLQPTFGFWHPTLTASIDKQWFDMDTNEGRTLNKPMASFRFDNTFDTKLAMFTLMMSYNTKGHEQNIYFRKPLFCTNMSIYKACMKNRLSFQLFVYDLFGTNDQHFIAHFGKLRSMAYDASSISKLTLTVRYAFNASRSKYKGTGAGTEQKGRM